MNFDNFKLNRQLLKAVEEAGYTQPTAIQKQAIPKILSGQNIIAIAQTGTGKTAAFVLPLLRILNFAQGHEPRCLVLVPTRELVLQIQQVFFQLGKYTGLRTIAVFGGAGVKQQKNDLEKGCDIVVATPAQAVDMYYQGYLQLKKIKHFVLDEAERLLDKGFTPQINKLLEVLPRKRQNLLFSATFGNRVKNVADDFILFPTIINIEPEIKTAPAVSQKVYYVPNFQSKLNLLNFLLHGNTFIKTIVFCRSKKTANTVFNFLSESGVENMRIVHGNKTQQSRTNALSAFSSDKNGLLITTDVASRGIDVINISHVINFDVPLIYEDYIHRIGRTGRAFSTGSSITFCTNAEEWHLRKIEKLIAQRIPEEIIPEEVEITKTRFAEMQEMKREIDSQKRKDNPEFKGAFHQKLNGKYGRKK